MSDFLDTRTSLAGLGALIGVAASTVTGAMASVTVGDTTVSCQVARGLTLALGDPVLLTRVGAQYVVTAVLYPSAPVDPEPPAPAPEPNPSATNGTLVISPVETRTWQPSSWSYTGDDAVYQGVYGGYENNTGCAFYGTAPESLAGATVTRATVAMRRLYGGAYAVQTPTMWLVTEATRPAGAPTLTSTMAGPSLAVLATASPPVDLPTSWAQAMVDGTAGGLAVYEADGSPYMKFAGRSDWSGAWVLTIYYTR